MMNSEEKKQAELNSKHETIFKIKTRMVQMNLETDNCYPCLNNSGLLVIDDNTFISHQCRDGMPQMYWFYLITKKEKDIYSVVEFDVRMLCSKYNLEINMNNLSSSNWEEMSSIIERGKELKISLTIPVEDEFDTIEVDTSHIPTSCKEDREMRSEIEGYIKSDLFSYLKEHSPSFKFLDDEWKKMKNYEEEIKEYSFYWGEIGGNLFCLPWDSFEDSIEYMDANQFLKIENDTLTFIGEYNDELLNWLRWELWSEEHPNGFEYLLEVKKIVENWKIKNTINEREDHDNQ